MGGGEGKRRRWGLRPPVDIGVAVECWVALLLGDALANGRSQPTTILMLSCGPFLLRYHVRDRRGAVRADTPGRLDCCTGRARLKGEGRCSGW
jgi:hypothetical protein